MEVQEEKGTVISSDYINELIKKGIPYTPHGDMVLYLMTYTRRSDEALDAPTYVVDALFGNDQDEDITKRKLWYISSGPDAKNCEDITPGTRIQCRGNAFKVSVRLNEDTPEETELVFFTLRDYDVIGHYA